MSRTTLVALSLCLAGCLPEPEDLAEQSVDASLLARTDAGAPAPDATAVDAAPAPDATPPDAALLPCTAGQAQATDPASGACYMLFTAPLGWAAAQSACELVPGKTHLVTITSLAEQDRVYALTNQQETWIGRSDALQESTWIWITKEAPALSHWADNEPNGGENENCAIVRPPTGQWDDRNCNEAHVYVCERDP